MTMAIVLGGDVRSASGGTRDDRLGTRGAQKDGSRVGGMTCQGKGENKEIYK